MNAQQFLNRYFLVRRMKITLASAFIIGLIALIFSLLPSSYEFEEVEMAGGPNFRAQSVLEWFGCLVNMRYPLFCRHESKFNCVAKRPQGGLVEAICHEKILDSEIGELDLILSIGTSPLRDFLSIKPSYKLIEAGQIPDKYR